MSNKRFDPFKKLEELPSLVYVVLAVLCLTVHVLLCTYTSISVAVCGLILIIAYAIMAFFIHLAVHKRISLFRIASDASEEQNNGVIYTFRHLLKIPYAVVTEKGKIVTVNAAMKNAAGAKSTGFNTDIKDIVSRVKLCFHKNAEHLLIYSRGLNLLFVTKLRIENVKRNIASVRCVFIRFSVKQK